MDESVSTVLTILCNHTFHSSCLAQWEDATCPVCRYVQVIVVLVDRRHEKSPNVKSPNVKSPKLKKGSVRS